MDRRMMVLEENVRNPAQPEAAEASGGV